MKISDLPEFKSQNHLLMLDQSTSLKEASKEMKKYNYGAALVTFKGKLTGIFTERDLLMKVVAEGKDYKKLTLKDVMTKKLITVNDENTIGDCVDHMNKGNFRHLPVVDTDGNVTGMLSQKDFIVIGWQQLMMRLVVTYIIIAIAKTQSWV